MSETLVNVALPVPVPQLFTYSVPPLFQDSIEIGSVVSVPFGSKTFIGVVIALTDQRPNAVMKNITDLFPSSFTVDKENIKTALWIAEYYNAPIGDTVKLFLPASVSQSSNRIISLNPDARPPVFEDRNRSKQWGVISAALASGPSSLRLLQRKTSIKGMNAAVHLFSRLDLLRIDEQLSARPTSKKEWILRYTEPSEIPAGKNDNQLQLLEYLRAHAGLSIPVKTVLHEAAVPLSTVKSFQKKNLVTLTQAEVSRHQTMEGDDQSRKSLTIQLNADQQKAVAAINAGLAGKMHKTFLLHGITGSGKTQVYIEVIRRVLADQQSAIVLVPEISLTPQTVRRFQAHFGENVVWIHSRMSVGERYDAWRLSKAGKYRIVIGPRSALFAPVQNLGLIIVDEEHESSYKQFDAVPRYHARDVAIVRGSSANAVVLLGSATPSIESYTNAIEGKYTLLELPERADHAILPPVKIVNMVEERKRRYAEMKLRAKEIGKKAFDNAARSISAFLEQQIRERLEKKEGIILLQNRRGFAPFIECISCGHVEQCDRCNVTMTYHAPKKHLRCHYCGKVQSPPTTCMACGGFEFSMKGFGTQRVEEELRALFPDAAIQRMDLDTTSRKNSHDTILKKFGSGETDILLGTQMVAKGLDFPRVTLVGVISADTQMMLPDFRSAERTFQLLTQVAGRAGRSTLRGEVIIQTSQPEHYALKFVEKHDFIGFYKEEVEFRRAIGYPPFARIIVIEVKGKTEKNVERIAEHVGRKLSALLPKDSILGPTPAVLSKIKDEYRWQIIVKAFKATDKNGTRARISVARVVQELHKDAAGSNVRILVDIDAVGIM